MADFDQTTAYAQQEAVSFDDGREIELLHNVYGRADLDELRGSPARVLAAIDEYGHKHKYLMNVGANKGAIVTKLIEERRPQVMVELGCYVGYSAILFGDAVRRAGGQRYVCLERNPEFAAVASSLLDLAGLGGVVRVVVGPSARSLRRLHGAGQLDRIDMLFLDHHKPAYLPDLKLCEQLGLVGPGSVLAADNVIKPGNPPYLAYVRASVESKRQGLGLGSAADGFGEWHMRMYERREGVETLDEDVRGDAALIYQSELVHGFEPTGVPDGVEVTRCVGREA